jgi:putative ABC transport system substrate-binding protein
MRRREFITLLCGAAGWPLAAAAQKARGVRRLGVLSSVPADDPEVQARMAAFHQGLQEAGWIIGRNLRIEYRWSTAGDAEQARQHVTELIALAPEVILAVATSSVGLLQQANRTTPIVFVQVSDPVGAGFIESLARPGGNTTGFTLFEFSLSTKWVELLKEIAPRVTRAAVLRDPGLASGIGQFAVMQSVAPLPGSLTLLHRKSIIALAAQHHLPAVYPFRYHVAAVATARSMSLASLTPTGVRSQPKRENQMSV